MGGKSKKARMEVVQYYMSIHYGVCHGPVDAFLGVTIDQKNAWSGEVTSGTIYVNNPGLFGGIKKEGGIEGQITFLSGASNQTMPSFLASRLGRTTETCPAFRGTATVFFTGSSRRGFYWRANSPYLPGTWIKVRRIPKGLNPSLARIGDDANPAHIIYEAMTNTDWGMGAPSTAFNIPSFEAAAKTLYDENFGLSLGWFAQGTIENFISEIIDHIDAVLFVDPETGLFTLKLIRNDYDPDTLPIITPDNADLSNFQRKLWAETVNEIVVTWTNPQNEEEETVTMQDPANIAMQGGIVSDSRNYYGVRNSDLAMRLATRDLRVASSPLASCEALVNRQLFKLKPGDCVKLTWPEWGINEAIMRVGACDYGRPGDPTIKVSLMEDVFSFTTSAYFTPPETEWQDESENPRPLTFHHIFTLPYYFVVNLVDPDLLVGIQYPSVFAGVLGAQNGQDTNQFDLVGVGSTDPLGNPIEEVLATIDIATRALIDVPLTFEAESTAVPLRDLTQGIGPVVGGFALIGSGQDHETELAVVSAWDGNRVSLVRGVLDTVPREWPAGTPIWFLNENMDIVDETIRAAGELVEYWPLPWTSRGRLSRNDAIKISGTVNERPWLPLRPANVTFAGETHGEIDTQHLSQVEITWANRNRLSEDALIMRWTDGDTAPEEGQTTAIEVYSEDGQTLLYEQRGLTGTSLVLGSDAFAGASRALVRVLSERDGLKSLQAHQAIIIRPSGKIARYDFTGVREIVEIPEGATEVYFELWGGAGGGGRYTNNSVWSGGGGWVKGVLKIQPGDVIEVEVGEGGESGSGESGNLFGGRGGWPDGGDGCLGDTSTGGGGGSTRLYKNNVLVAVAGGGGGCGGFSSGGSAGAGGGLEGQNAENTGGTGGTQSAGGYDSNAASNVAKQGGYLKGGKGGDVADRFTQTSDDGGGGGGGYYGGGGGGGDGRSGGGGSSFLSEEVMNGVTEAGDRQTPGGVNSINYPGNGIAFGVISKSQSAPSDDHGGHGHAFFRFNVEDDGDGDEFTPPRPDLLKYWFAADRNVFSDLEGTTPAMDGQGVAVWGNLGTAEDAKQSNPANRPVFRTGGLAGKPYIECVASEPRFFSDLIGLGQLSGDTFARPWTVIVVTDNIDVNAYPGILGSAVPNGGKVGLYFRPPANEQIHFMKTGWRVGNVVNPQILFVGNRRNSNPETEDTYTNAYNLLYYRINGVSDLSTNSSVFTSSAISQVQFLRNTGVSGGGNFHGHLYEIMIYDGVIPRSMWKQIEDYLKQKYGFTFTSGPFE